MTNMIQGYVEVFNLPKVMQTFQDGVSQGIKPDRAAYNFLIRGFMDHDRLDDAVTCLQHMRKAKLNPTTDTWNMLLESCAKNRRWPMGATLIKEIESSGFKITNPSLRRNYLLLKSHT
jgi:pentatricopeptide repeat protein